MCAGRNHSCHRNSYLHGLRLVSHVFHQAVSLTLRFSGVKYGTGKAESSQDINSRILGKVDSIGSSKIQGLTEHIGPISNSGTIHSVEWANQAFDFIFIPSYLPASSNSDHHQYCGNCADQYRIRFCSNLPV